MTKACAQIFPITAVVQSAHTLLTSDARPQKRIWGMKREHSKSNSSDALPWFLVTAIGVSIVSIHTWDYAYVITGNFQREYYNRRGLVATKLKESTHAVSFFVFDFEEVLDLSAAVLDFFAAGYRSTHVISRHGIDMKSNGRTLATIVSSSSSPVDIGLKRRTLSSTLTLTFCTGTPMLTLQRLSCSYSWQPFWPELSQSLLELIWVRYGQQPCLCYEQIASSSLRLLLLCRRVCAVTSKLTKVIWNQQYTYFRWHVCQKDIPSQRCVVKVGCQKCQGELGDCQNLKREMSSPKRRKSM